jgi:RNA polymerase subunit RPABC4/transcription elongation factor Spt4
MHNCPTCNKIIEASHNFCPNCGMPVYVDVTNNMSLCAVGDNYKSEWSFRIECMKREAEEKERIKQTLLDMQQEIKELKQNLMPTKPDDSPVITANAEKQKKTDTSYVKSKSVWVNTPDTAYMMGNRYKEAGDKKRALECYMKSRYLDACNRIAAIYSAEKKYRQAWEWYKKSADEGDRTGQFYVDYFYNRSVKAGK